MSHEATIWAIKQTGLGLTPGAKLVLWHLADRHNPDFGCFPRQERLAADCEMSRSTINEHLSTLEAKGLIRRERRTDSRTKRQMPTRYVFAFEGDFGSEPTGSDTASEDGTESAKSRHAAHNKAQEKPCPESGHGTRAVSENAGDPCPEIGKSRVRLSEHVEPVREPIREPCVGGASAAHNSTDFQAFWKTHPRPRDREASAKLFAEAVEAGEDPKRITQAAERYAAENAGNKAMYVAYSTSWLENQRWRDYPPEPLPCLAQDSDVKAAAFWAAKIKSGRYVPPSAINPALAGCMLRNGLVTADQMRRAGLSP